MSDYILSRQILIALFFVHCLFSYLGSTVKLNVPAKVYNACFLTEVLVLTAYIIYTCVTEPFYNGIAAGIFGYLMVYLSIWFSYAALQHWTIVPDKIYDFHPENVRCWEDGDHAVGGYITESGKKMFVYIDDEELCETVKKDSQIKVKYREWRNFAAHFDLVE